MDLSLFLKFWFAITTFNIFVLGLGFYLFRNSIESIKRRGGIRKSLIHAVSRSTWERLWNN
ncbi:hypothetical protein ACS78_08030 [Priestia megaterium]|nr:hypothetical protein ACS78_08030 [Priestia megaterium]